MKYIITLLAISIFIVFSCTNKKKSGLITSPDSMQADEYVITIDRDTTIETKNGALLKIPKGALETDKGNIVTLEIKEAYSMQQMIQAGLTTQSKDGPLSSGGMIYINAAAGQNVKIKQGIKVAIPTSNLRKDMQLYKGEKDANGNINWNDRTPLPENKQLTSIQKGATLFQTRCTSCHMIGKDFTGPDLANIKKRPYFNQEGGWPYFYPHFYTQLNRLLKKQPYADTTSKMPSDTIAMDRIYTPEGSNSYYAAGVYFCKLKSMFGSIGTDLSNLSINELDDIYNYIQNESNTRNLPFPSHVYLDDCIDSCRTYMETTRYLQRKKDEAAKDNGNLTPTERNQRTINTAPDTAKPTPPPPPVVYDKKVSPDNYGSVYYQFTIETFGWFNIDILMKGLPGVENSELFIRIQGEYREKIQVYLIIPSVKAFIQGGKTGKEADQYAFDDKNGQIPLPQNDKAYIMAITEADDKSVAYVLQEFTISLKQTIEISLKAGTKEEFNAAFTKLGFESLNFKAVDSKNSEEIRKIDRQLNDAEKLKPKNCSCDCAPVTDSAAPEINSADYIGPQSKPLNNR